MLRDNESLHVKLRPDFSLSFILARRLPLGGGHYREQILSEQKLRTAAQLATREEVTEQVATLIRYLQKMIDRETGEPERVTCPFCGWLAGEKTREGFACFNCRKAFEDADVY